MTLSVGGVAAYVSVVTLMILPVLQATQNRDGAALQAKLDELIKTSRHVRDSLIGLENGSEDDIERLRNTGEDAGGTKLPPTVTGR